MKYELQITYDDYKAAQRLHSAPRRRFMFLLYPLLAFFALVVFYSAKRFLSGGDGQGFYCFLGLTVYLFLLFGVLLPYRWRKNYKQQKLLHKPFQYEFTPDTFNTFTDYGNGTVPWKEFHKWRESKTVFLVYQSDVLFHLIPKRIFQNPQDQTQFRSYLMDKIGKPVI